MTNNNILDVLTYMFDYLFEVAEQDASQEIDDTALKAHLSDAGFEVTRIDKALSWLENIATLQWGNSSVWQRQWWYAHLQRRGKIKNLAQNLVASYYLWRTWVKLTLTSVK
ncbi:Protein of unknown function Smg [uncultured Gammaproteobacteria bacterium]|nr:Protein of unknown function Smg [uncultured Gammaproteobacteria bacterium]